MIMVARPRGHHVLPHQEVRRTHLPPGRREPLGERSLPATRRRHAGAARPTSREWPARCSAGFRVLVWPNPMLVLSAHAHGAHSLSSRPASTSGRLSSSDRLWQQTGCQQSGHQETTVHVAASSLTSGEPSFSLCCIVFSFPAVIELRKQMEGGIIRSRAVTRFNCTISTGAMSWLGEVLPKDQQTDKTPFAPRCVKDRVEEDLFAHRRDLFTDLQLVFF